MRVFSVHERPVQEYNGCIYHPFLNVVTKYFELGDEIFYGCSDKIKITAEKASKLEKVNNPKIHFIHLNRINSLQSLIRGNIKNNRIVKQTVEQSDIVVARLPSFSGLQAVYWAKKLKKPYIVEVIGCAWDGYWNYGLKGKLLAPGLFTITKKAILHATHVVYVTDKFLQTRYPTKGKSIGASNVSIDKVSDEVIKHRIKSIEKMTGETINLATASGIDNPLKGHQYVIEAISELNSGNRKYHYYIIGGGSPERLKGIAEKFGVNDYVHFVGQLNQKDVIKFYDKIDIYIQPSKQEGLPRALIEAMSQGCPAIGSNIAGIPELIDSEYLFRKGSVYEIKQILSSFNKNNMLQQANINFHRAQKYEQQCIKERRTEFFRLFKKDYNLI